MNIIICGAGRVGFSISKQLSAQGHSITVIDQLSELIQKINDTQDVKGFVGRATFPSVLEKAGAEDADMIIAVTQNDETNMVICQVAYSIFKINKKIARIRGQEFLGKKWGKLYGESNLPIDVIISPELEVAKSLQRKLDAPGALDSVPFVNGKIKVLEINIGKNCPLVNTELGKLTEQFPDLRANVLGVIRGEKFVILKKKDKMLINDNFSLSLEIKKLEAGDTALKNTGNALPDETFEAIKNSDACLKAPVGESAKDVIVYLRRMLDLYANIRPAKSYPNMPALRDDVDLVIVRENTEDLYTGEEFDIGDAAVAMRIISEKASRRIANHAFTIASKRKMKKVTCVHKSNVMKKTDGLFASTCSKVAENFPDVKFEEMYVDACAMNLIRQPQLFDVIVTTNLFGDILSDESAQVVGGLGIAPAANIGDDFGLFEPVHGAAFDIAGKHIANPTSFILSIKMMLEWLGNKHNDKKCTDAGQKLESVVYDVVKNNIKTMDTGGDKTTMEFTKEIISRL